MPGTPTNNKGQRLGSDEQIWFRKRVARNRRRNALAKASRKKNRKQ